MDDDDRRLRVRRIVLGHAALEDSSGCPKTAGAEDDRVVGSLLDDLLDRLGRIPGGLEDVPEVLLGLVPGGRSRGV